ncbi:MAG TPA: helix-turn-helix domain-containing protein [Rubricoccaceae bacterium]|jgi:hypothetical protein
MADSNTVAVIHPAALAALLDAAVERAVDRSLRRNLATLLGCVAEGEEWVSPAVASKLFGKHRTTLHRWSRAGLLPTRRLGGSVFYNRHAVGRLAGGA